MQYCYLGSTGLRVSELCLGGLTFGRETSESVSRQILNRFAGAGGNFIDTGNAYYPPTPGASEEIIGRWLENQRRDDFVITTKVFFPMGDGPNDFGLSRKHILSAVEGSLRRLQTDYIDLYQVHCWDRGTPLEETLSTLNDLVRSGKVRYIGASNFTAGQLQKALALSRHNGWSQFASLQVRYNLLCRATEWELIPTCQEERLGIICYSPLEGGWLTGKYRRDMDDPPAGSRWASAEQGDWPETWQDLGSERTWQLIDVLLELADSLDVSPAQVAIRWVMQRAGVTAPIIGTRTMEQLKDNLAAANVELSPAHLRRLKEASTIAKPYPYDFIEDVERRYQR